MGHNRRVAGDTDALYDFPFTVAPFELRKVGTWTATLLAPGFNVTQGAAGADKIDEFSVVRLGADTFLELRKMFTDGGTVERCACFVGPYGRVNPTATTYAGIELGSFGQGPPFPSVAAHGAVAQLRHVYSTDKIELLLQLGDGVAGEHIVQLDPVGSGIYPHGVYLELVHDTIANEVRAYVDGVLGARVTGASAYFDPGAYPSIETIAGLFVTSGSNAAANSTQAIFSHWQYGYLNVLPANRRR